VTRVRAKQLESARLSGFFALLAENAPEFDVSGVVPARGVAGPEALGAVLKSSVLALGEVDVEEGAVGAEVSRAAAGAGGGLGHCGFEMGLLRAG